MTMLHTAAAIRKTSTAVSLLSSLELSTSAHTFPCESSFAVLEAHIDPECEHHCRLLTLIKPAKAADNRPGPAHTQLRSDFYEQQQTDIRLLSTNLVPYNDTAMKAMSEEVLLEVHCSQSSPCTAEPSRWTLGSLQQPFHIPSDHAASLSAPLESTDCVTRFNTLVTADKHSKFAEEQGQSSVETRNQLLAWLVRLGTVVSLTAVYKLL